MSSGSVPGSRRPPAAAAPDVRSANFGFLRAHHPMLVRLGALGEVYALLDPNSATIKVRLFGELLAQQLAARAGVAGSPLDTHFDLLKRPELDGVLPREVSELLHEIRRAGNAAAHRYEGTPPRAVSLLAMAREAGVCFHHTFTNSAFEPSPFAKPQPVVDVGAELRAQAEQLRAELGAARAAADAAGQSATHVAEQRAHALAALEQRVAAAADDQAATLALTEDVERQLDQERTRLTAELGALRAQAQAAGAPAGTETV